MAPAQVIVDLSLGTATGVLSALLVVLFVVRGLHRFYPVFFGFWIFDVLQSLLVFLAVKRETLGRIEAGVLIIQWVFYFLLVLELVDRILSDHPGIARLGRRVLQVAMIVATAVAVYSLKLDSTSQSTIADNLRLLLQAERVVAACLLMILLLINLFLWYFPVRLNRNTKAYCWGFTLFFLAKAIAPYLLTSRGLSFVEQADMIHLSAVLVCQMMWLFAITRKGVECTPAFPRDWSLVEQQKVLSTLDALEQQISRTRGH